MSVRPTRFARQLLDEWRRLGLPQTDTGVIVAVSGGADSSALLLALDELIRKQNLAASLTVAHFDHGLRAAASKQDARWVKELATRLGYHVALGRTNVRTRAAKSGDNLEQAARLARYRFLARTANSRRAGLVLTAHTMDDQAETVLLNLIRGSGTDGLGGIDPVRSLDGRGKVLLARPLLSWARRAGTEHYCQSRGVEFRIDAMNADESFARVRVRRKLLPLMQTFNVRIVEALARTAGLLRDDRSALAGATEVLIEAARENSGTSGKRNEPPGLRADLLKIAPAAVRRRALRHWIAQGRGDLRRIELVHILAVESLLSGNRGGRVIELPGGSLVSRNRGCLWFHGSARSLEKAEFRRKTAKPGSF